MVEELFGERGVGQPRSCGDHLERACGKGPMSKAVAGCCSWCRLCRAFDVEMLYIAQQLNIPIAEVAVTWTEIDGSSTHTSSPDLKAE